MNQRERINLVNENPEITRNSLNDLLEVHKHLLESQVFEVTVDSNLTMNQTDSLFQGNMQSRVFVQFKRKVYEMGGIKKTMLTMQDVSQSIFFDQAHAEKQFMAITNATVSHELRGPL